MSRGRAFALVAGAVVMLIAARAAWTWETTRRPDVPSRELDVPQGANVADIAAMLQREGVVARAFTFRAVVRLRGDAARLRAGRYRFEGPLSLNDVVDILVRGDVVRRLVTFPEGRSRFEFADIAATAGFDAAEFLGATTRVSAIPSLPAGAASLEGYLYPDTYDVAEMRGAAALVESMARRFRSVAAELRLETEAHAGAVSGRRTVHEIVTLASIVELETGQAFERPLIASVFFNRLRIGMPLQTDPTVIYALRLAGRWNGNIRRDDLRIDSPYNTYARRGLPPGPIGSPGRDALVAVLRPAASKALYFVSRNDGTHVFSNTLREHERAVDQYQRRARRQPAS